MKSIESKIIMIVIVIVSAACILLGTAGSLLNIRTAQDVLNKNMSETASIAAELIEARLTQTLQVAQETGCTRELADPSVSIPEKQQILNQKIETYHFTGGNLLDTSGTSMLDGTDFSDRDYFQASLKGETFISGPLISKLTGEYSIMISAPIWKDGVPETEVMGVIYFKPDIYLLSDIVSTIQVGNTGSAYIINKNGLTIANADRDLVFTEQSVVDVAEDSSLKKIAEIETDMIAGKSGYDSYHYDGVKWIQAYTPIPNTDGWSVGVYAEEREFLGNVRLSVFITVIMAAFFILAGYLLARAAASKISAPILKCVQRIGLLASGDLTSEVPVIESKDETALLADSTRELVAGLADVVRDITYVLGEMAAGNLNVHSSRTYTGDFVPIQTATNEIIAALNNALTQIRVSAEQVAGGSSQVADGAQALAQNSTEQASAAEELTATVNEIAGQVHTTAENARKANEQSQKTRQEVEACNSEMEHLVNAMAEIHNASNEINHIIKNIESIATQTNLLSLNASIEAARAGEAGKGFAVVADEVGNLAADSSQAAKTTTELIAAAIATVKKGTGIVNDTAAALSQVVENTQTVSMAIEEITAATETQSESIEQIMHAIAQISDSIQTNSATSEESSAASEELSAQAGLLNAQVEKFKLQK